jgi:Kef-type K+ transport system membrane component KefB
LPWPVGEKWLLFYGLVLTGLLLVVKRTTNLHLEVLIPAFMLGCLIDLGRYRHVKKSRAGSLSMDVVVKGGFMLLVGLSFPKVELGAVPLTVTVWHVLALTVLANLGKCFPALCYRREAGFKERLALSIAMFPRGEVGAAVLAIGLGYGFGNYISALALLSLALNLVLTGIFIAVVIRLLENPSFKCSAQISAAPSS